MNPDALLQPGNVPWSPNQDVSGLDVWNAYEHPLTGTFESRGGTVLFTVVSDFEGHMSLWAYTPLSGVESAKLADRQFASAADLHLFIEGFFDGREVLFALAADGRIVRWAPARKDGPLPDLAIMFMNDMLTTLSRPTDPETEIRVKLAQAATAAAELIDA